MERFYPLTTLSLFNEAIQDTSTIVEISDSNETIIRHSRKILLFHSKRTWKKKSEDPNLDVIMSCYDGAEFFVDLFFTQIKQHFN